MLGWVSRLIGPKVMLGLLVAALAGLAVSVWGWRSSSSTASHLEAELFDAQGVIDSLIVSMDVSDDIQVWADDRSAKMQARLIELQSELERLKNEASDEVRRAGDTVLPDDLADGLRQ